ncbi:CoA-binding protein [Natranaeroarchaeum sulfidigenes]|uniref:Putative CoA-binding protein n=1 Tax=Natranaeroarchaeum sulfidigenes TaxID=2784880 RepID=A0A897MRY3_9EURY|nr:CoA-binding protein [Natranaeroarchaeum sulfidigenes]QSG03061.1 putative CoA-binding protein [Natranaeroarchaeum sulfidigenes]
MDADELITAALESETIAVIGCSSTPGKDAHDVPSYLDSNGYGVIPVNPYADEILGRTAYDSLTDVPHEVDLVDVFRPSEEVSGIVDSVLERDDVGVLWLQLGISDDEAAARAREAGIDVVQDRCLKIEHSRRQ